jgi:hypothetical protein
MMVGCGFQRTNDLDCWRTSRRWIAALPAWTPKLSFAIVTRLLHGAAVFDVSLRPQTAAAFRFACASFCAPHDNDFLLASPSHFYLQGNFYEPDLSNTRSR